MPVSSELCKKEMLDYIERNVLKDEWIIDVGAGVGTYRNLLVPKGYNNIDGIEIYTPYIAKYGLNEKYKTLYNEDVRTFDFSKKKYSCAILGDVLEHLTANDAQELLKTLFDNVEHILISVPYDNKQGIYDGNIYETHHQFDLSDETFKTRYPMFKKIAEGEDLEGKKSGKQYDHITAWVWSKSN